MIIKVWNYAISVTIETKFWTLTCCMNLSYEVSNERANDLSLQYSYIVSILWELIILWCRYVKFTIWRRKFTIEYLCVLFVGGVEIWFNHVNWGLSVVFSWLVSVLTNSFFHIYITHSHSAFRVFLLYFYCIFTSVFFLGPLVCPSII